MYSPISKKNPRGIINRQAALRQNNNKQKCDTWQESFRQSHHNTLTFCADLNLEPEAISQIDITPRDFPFLLSETLASQITPGDSNNPILRQFLPDQREYIQTPGFLSDPLAEEANQNNAGLIHKYSGRALLIVTSVCAVNCRYCFRRHRPKLASGHSTLRYKQALASIAKDPEIKELILSGGDPLMVDDDVLANIFHACARIPHLRRVRIHSRMPVALPDRVTPQLCAELAKLKQDGISTIMVTHCNHADELGTEAEDALQRLSACGAQLLNQSVLLAGINDSTEILCALSERLFSCGVMPYYLHQLDPVQGAAHFQVSDARAHEIIAAMWANLPGYLVPKLVREIPGQASKTPL